MTRKEFDSLPISAHIRLKKGTGWSPGMYWMEGMVVVKGELSYEQISFGFYDELAGRVWYIFTEDMELVHRDYNEECAEIYNNIVKKI